MDSVEMERALETQRLALLRLLAGLVLVLRLVSFAPVVSLLPRWVRLHVSSVLIRSESATQSLVYVAAIVFCGHRGAWPGLPARVEVLPEGGYSAEVLLRRIAALRAVLEDLPRYAKRLLKRQADTRETILQEWVPLGLDVLPPAPSPLRARIERPPDKRAPHDPADFPLAPS